MKKYSLIIGALLVGGTALADTETTKWYIDGKLYETTSCETGGDITLPTTPEMFGNTFQGWAPAIYDMSTLNTNINGSGYTYNNSAKTWNVSFSYGTVYGISGCSTINSAAAPRDDINEAAGGQFCYCRVTEFIPLDSTTAYEPVASRWVFDRDGGSASSCAGNCAARCGDYVQGNLAMRVGMFGSVSQ